MKEHLERVRAACPLCRCARIVRLIGVAYQVVGDLRGPRTESGRELLVDGLDLGEVQQFDQLVVTRLCFLWLAGREVGEPMVVAQTCLLYTSPSPRDVEESRMPSSA